MKIPDLPPPFTPLPPTPSPTESVTHTLYHTHLVFLAGQPRVPGRAAGRADVVGAVGAAGLGAARVSATQVDKLGAAVVGADHATLGGHRGHGLQLQGGWGLGGE